MLDPDNYALALDFAKKAHGEQRIQSHDGLTFGLASSFRDLLKEKPFDMVAATPAELWEWAVGSPAPAAFHLATPEVLAELAAKKRAEWDKPRV